MNVIVRFVAVAGTAIALSACVYYPHGPYGPGYGPYEPGYDRGGPPPPGPGYDQGPGYNSGPPPGPGYNSGPPPEPGYAPEAARGDENRQIAKMNDPQWCQQHPKKCAKLHQKYGEAAGGPPRG